MNARLPALYLSLLCGAVSLSGCRCRGGGADTQDASKESPGALHLKDVEGLTPPTARTAEALPVDAIAVYVSRTKLLLGDELTEILPLSDPASLAKDGIDRKYKPGDSHYVVLLADAIMALRKQKGLGEWTPVAISMDASLPYAVLADVLVTLQRVRVDRYALVVKGDRGAAAFQLSFAPRTSSPPPAPSTSGSTKVAASALQPASPDAPVYLGVRIDEQGYAVRVFGRELGAGCELGVGLPVPKRDAAYDPAGLAACVMKNKALAPSTHDDAVSITSLGSVDYQTVVQTLDAVRAAPDGKPLFPAVSFAIVH